MVEAIAMAVLPGFPQPLVEGPLFEALLAFVNANGQPRPVLVDRAGVAWGERTLVNVCQALGVSVETREVADGMAAAIHELTTRDLSVLEQADLVRHIYENPSIMFMPEAPAKRSIAVSAWFKSTLGKDRGFSPNQIERYLRVARSPADLRRKIAGADTLNKAILILSREVPPAPNREAPSGSSSAEETVAIKAATAFTDALLAVPAWSTTGLDRLLAVKAALDQVLRNQTATVTAPDDPAHPDDGNAGNELN